MKSTVTTESTKHLKKNTFTLKKSNTPRSSRKETKLKMCEDLRFSQYMPQERSLEIEYPCTVCNLNRISVQCTKHRNVISQWQPETSRVVYLLYIREQAENLL